MHRLNEDGTMYVCLSCGYKARSRRTVFEHIESKHVHSAGYTCGVCTKFCKTRNALRSHMARYHPVKVAF